MIKKLAVTYNTETGEIKLIGELTALELMGLASLLEFKGRLVYGKELRDSILRLEIDKELESALREK